MSRWEFFKYLFLIFTCFIIYLLTLSFYFCSDDFDRIGPFSLSEVIKCFYNRCNISENAVGWYRPTSILLYFFEYHIWGHNPFGYHLSNLILHILNTILVYFLVKIVIKKDDVAFLSSIFFAIHPIHTEAVAWICIRHTLLVTLFYLLSFTFFINYIESKEIKFYLISIIFFILALCSKEEAITLPLVILLYIFIFEKKFLLKNSLKLFLPYFSLLIIYFLFKLFILGTLGGYGFELKFLKYSFPDYIKYFIMNKLKMLYLPYIYPYLLLPWFSIFLIGVVPIFLYYFKFKDYTFLIIWLFITMLPLINLETGIHMGGWYMYLPSVSFCILLSLFIFLLLRNSSKYYKLIGSFMILTLSIFYIYTTVNRLKDWMIASELCRNIPLQIKKFIPEIKPNTKIYLYGIPHNYKGAYIYANGFENALRMTFNDKSLKGFPEFHLRFPVEMFTEENFSDVYFFAFIYGDIFKITLHRNKNYLLFRNKKGEYFKISVKEYYEVTEEIIRSYMCEDGAFPASKQMEINEKISAELLRFLVIPKDR